MGIRDALRSIRGGDKKAREDEAAEGSEAEAPEPTWFQPRYDGAYRAVPADPPIASPTLRFLPGGKVFETDDTDSAPAAEQPNPCRGEYTAAGRFNVQRRFERIISYAVLEMEPGETETTPGFVARRIDAADRSTAELHFAFRPDSPSDADGA